MLIVRTVGNVGGDDNLVCAVDGDLRIVPLDEGLSGSRHDARVGIGEVALRFIGWTLFPGESICFRFDLASGCVDASGGG